MSRFSSVGTGAVGGAAAGGAMGGPWGAAAGGLIGAGLGFMEGSDREEQQEKQDEERRRYEEFMREQQRKANHVRAIQTRASAYTNRAPQTPYATVTPGREQEYNSWAKPMMQYGFAGANLVQNYKDMEQNNALKQSQQEYLNRKAGMDDQRAAQDSVLMNYLFKQNTQRPAGDVGQQLNMTNPWSVEG